MRFGIHQASQTILLLPAEIRDCALWLKQAVPAYGKTAQPGAGRCWGSFCKT